MINTTDMQVLKEYYHGLDGFESLFFDVTTTRAPGAEGCKTASLGKLQNLSGDLCMVCADRKGRQACEYHRCRTAIILVEQKA